MIVFISVLPMHLHRSRRNATLGTWALLGHLKISIIMSPPRLQCFEINITLFTLLLLFSTANAQEPGELMKSYCVTATG